jgi:hypothetical protein
MAALHRICAVSWKRFDFGRTSGLLCGFAGLSKRPGRFRISNGNCRFRISNERFVSESQMDNPFQNLANYWPGIPMSEALTLSALARWRADPISFVETVLVNPETKRPFVLLEAERAFLAHAFRLDDNGKLLYPEQVYSCPKKSGKTTFAALHVLTLTLLFGGAYPEANALRQRPGAGARPCL